MTKQRTSNINTTTKTTQQRKKVNRPKKSLADKDYKRPETNKNIKREVLLLMQICLQETIMITNSNLLYVYVHLA